MDRHEIFDKYIAGALSEAEELSFNEELKSNKSLAEDFQVYLSTVSAVIKEAEQDDMDFAVAMKGLEEEDVKEIIGFKERVKLITFERPNFLRTIYAAVAMIVGVFTLSTTLTVQYADNKYTNNMLCMITEYNYIPGITRGGQDSDIELVDDIANVSEEKLSEILPLYEKSYTEAESDQDIQTYGMNLSMVYLKLHKVEEAQQTLNELYNKYKSSESEFDIDYAHQCKKIIDQLERL
jgi:hypothetical protein